MNYKQMKKCGDKLSVLGFGCMRFPTENNGSIDEKRSEKMILSAIESGINYFDTAYPYHDGQSEPFVGKVLSGGRRKNIFLATKLPSWAIHTRDDMDKYLNEQLKRLQTDYIDYYLIHALNTDFWNNLVKLGIFEFMDKIKSEGKIRHIGFSFHDEQPVFNTIIESYNWDFCQIQYNYVNENYQAGRKGFDLAVSKGIDVIIMEPLLGGKLAENLPDDVAAIWEEAAIKHSPAEWALKWLWNQDGVDVVLSGMSTETQLAQNIEFAGKKDYNVLTDKDMQLISRVKKIYTERIKVPCTKCRYCMPCPHGVNIPECFSMVNSYYMFNNLDKSKGDYNFNLKGKSRASGCVECGECETKCPQNIEIIKSLKETVELFGE
ncbi:MAG: aldo/keto reductase [Spirochaetes bacterium]|nr:aldo/keto reductase [Spirochaetota bacterium]